MEQPHGFQEAETVCESVHSGVSDSPLTRMGFELCFHGLVEAVRYLNL